MSAKRSRRARPEPDVSRSPKRSKRALADASGDEPVAASTWLVSAFKILLGLGVLFGAATVVAWGAHRFMTTTTRFAVEHVEVEGTRRYSDVELLSLAGIGRRANLFDLDLDAAERTLTSDPWIESAQIARKLPNTLAFSVVELAATALASIDGTLYLVTRDGRPIKPLQANDASDFPVITGISAELLAQDRALAQERLALGVSVLEHYARVGASKAFPPQGVQLDEDGGVSLTAGVPALTLKLGRGGYRQKLLMAGRIIGKLRSKGETPGLIFLDNEAHPERVVVRMR